MYNGYSSAFQEFRSNHFHAGLDLRTFRKTGYKVYAIADGHIYKIRVVKRGSGNGLYIKHLDGNSSNYFHLDRFNRQVEGIARKVRQGRGKKYFGNYFLEKPISVKRGDLIGYSGETGSGFPHLHLEIRDNDNRAINPFPLLEWPGADRNHPVFHSLLLRSHGDSMINGEVGEILVRFKKSSDNSHTYVSRKPFFAVGDFDMVLDARDIADTGKKVAIYEISALIDGKPCFHTRFDRFAWEDNNQLGFVYDMFYTSPSRYFFNLFFQPGFNLENSKINLSELLDRLEPGPHQLEIKVKDHHHNVATGLVHWYRLPRPRIEVSDIRQEEDRAVIVMDRLHAPGCEAVGIEIFSIDNRKLYSGRLEELEIDRPKELILTGISSQGAFVDFKFLKEGKAYYRQRFILNGNNCSLPDIKDIPLDIFINRDDVFVRLKDFLWPASHVDLDVLDGGKSRSIKPWTATDGLYFRFKPADYETAPAEKPPVLSTTGDLVLSFVISVPRGEAVKIQKYLKILHLQDGVQKQFKWGDFAAEFHTHSVREPRVLYGEVKSFAVDYPVLSRQISLYPYHFPFLDLVYYKFENDAENPQQVGIFKYDYRSKRWRYVYTIYEESGHTFKTKVLSSGTFALMRDIYPPTVTLTRLRTQYLKNLKRLVLYIRDKGKGVNDHTLRISLNGKRVECEYDYDWQHVLVEDLRYARIGENILTVRIMDYGANLTVKRFKFFLK